MTASSAPWSLWKAQVQGLLRLEVKKYLFSKRAVLVYLLALFPISIAAMWNLVPILGGNLPRFGEVPQIFADMWFYGFILRLVVFFSCVVTFTHLFRGEVLERSLHYYFLCPLRREVLVAGKYLAGQIASWIIFLGVTSLSYILVFLPFGGEGIDYLLTGPGLWHLVAYLFIVVLACLGYGAVFMLMGMLFRNPIIPAVAVFLWEAINLFLPAMLQKISVIHYLIALSPVPLQQTIGLRAAAPSAWFSVPGLILFTAGVLLLAGWRVRRMEISYSGD